MKLIPFHSLNECFYPLAKLQTDFSDWHENEKN